jgi:hypothetical protein
MTVCRKGDNATTNAIQKEWYLPGKKCPPSSARNFLLAGEPYSRFWNGAEVVKEGADRS